MSFVTRPGRIDIKLPIVVGVPGERITAETRNISLGGVFVAASAPLWIGQPVSLELALPRLDKPLVVAGEVRWVRASAKSHHSYGVPGIGLRFVKPPLYALAALDNFVRSHTRDR
jgi:uncharacterized protein (TIGR02266 family)